MSDEKQQELSVRADTKIITKTSANPDIGIRGLEGTPISAIPLPRVKLVHPTTKGAVNAKGEKVPVGKFLNVQSCKVYDNFNFSIIRAKPGVAEFKDPKTGELQRKDAFFLIGADDENKVFAMTITGASFWSFRSLLGMIKGSDAKSVWEVSVSAVADDREGDYGAYKYIKFSLGEKASKENLVILEDLYKEYGAALDDAAPTPQAVQDVDPDDIPF